MRMQFTAVVSLAVLGLVAAAEPVKFDKPENWAKNNQLVFTGDGIMELRGNRADIFSKPFVLDPAKKYVFSAEIRCKPDTPASMAFVGNWSLNDANLRMLPEYVMAVSGTETTLLENVAKGAVTVTIAKPSGWSDEFKKRYWGLVFGAKADLSDLPNATYDPVTAAEVSGDRVVLTLRTPLKQAWPAGTAVRMHSSGNGMYGGWAYKKTPADWTRVNWTVAGKAATGNPANKWWGGSTQGAIRIISNYDKVKDSVLQVRNVTMEVTD